MRAFRLRAMTKDLTEKSEVIIMTEDGTIFEVASAKVECTEVIEDGEIKQVQPCNLVIVLKEVVPLPPESPPKKEPGVIRMPGVRLVNPADLPQKAAGRYVKGSGV